MGKVMRSPSPTDFNYFISRKWKDLHFSDLGERKAKFGDKPSNRLEDDYLNYFKEGN
jgi:hypothetical protein